MRILFLNPPFKHRISRDSRWPEKTKSGTLYYPMWLSYAAGLAMREHEVLLIDAIAQGLDFRETKRELEKFSPDLLVIETTTPTVMSDFDFVNYIGDLNAKILMVGSHVSALPEWTLKSCKRIDFVARGEFDYTVMDLARNLERPGKVKGISFRRGKKILHTQAREFIKDLDSLPFVSRVYEEFLNLKDYGYSLARKPLVQIFSSRGCPNRCVFCQLPQTFSGRLFRVRSPKNFVEEMEYIENNMGVEEVFIEDDTFTIDKQRVRKICRLMIRKKLRIIWSANVRADVDLETMKLMKRAGARLLVVGYESGSQRVLNTIKKGIAISMSRKFAENAKKVGLRVFGCWMIGLPGDTRESILETWKLAKELDSDMVFFQQAVPFPGTEMYEWAKKKRYLVTEDFSKWLDENGRLGFLLDYPWLSAEEIKYWRDKLMKSFYLSPKYLLKTLIRNMEPHEMIRVLRSAKEFLGFLLKEVK